MINAIAAVDINNGIGFNGNLLAHIPEDAKFFKNMTLGHTVVMGRKTFDSLPNRPLPFRRNWVISNSISFESEHTKFMTLETLKDKLKFDCYNNQIFIIGGASIYEQLLPLCDKIYLTKIFKAYDNVDSYFPDIPKDFHGKSISEIKTYKDISYQFWLYER